MICLMEIENINGVRKRENYKQKAWNLSRFKFKGLEKIGLNEEEKKWKAGDIPAFCIIIFHCEKIILMKKQTPKTEKFMYIFTICALLVVLAIFLILFFTGFLFSFALDPVTNLPLGNSPIVMNVSNSQATSISFSVKGSIVPGEKLPQKINVKNDGESEVYLRAKSYIYTIDQGQIEMSLDVTSGWVLKDDGYYYFLETLPKNASVGLSSRIIVNDEYNFDSKNEYQVNIIIESLDQQFDVVSIWGINPKQIAVEI